jgi:phosphate uptake regulator
MFDWFINRAPGMKGLARMRTEFAEMLDAGRKSVRFASDALLEPADLPAARRSLLELEKRIDLAEQQIRREIVVHIAVHGTTQVPACLVLMSIVKDAERVGDYAMNLFDLAEIMPHPPTGEHRRQIGELIDRVIGQITTCYEVFNSQDKNLASELVDEGRRMEKFCDRQVDELVRGESAADLPVAYALTYRYLKRVVSHTDNVATSIIQPLDKLDYYDHEEDAPG